MTPEEALPELLLQFESMSEKRNIRTVLVDDSPQARKLLKLMLIELAPDFQILGEAEDAEDGLRLIESLNPEVAFLDIEMPGKSGIQLAESLADKGGKTQVVFTTAYNQYAIKAFRLSAIDYLLKPLQEDQLSEAVQKIRDGLDISDRISQLEALKNNFSEDRQDVLCIPMQGGYEYVPLDDIEYLEANGSYVQIYCTNNRCKMVSKNLKYFESALEDVQSFIRPHRSYVVNLKFVTYYSKADGGFLVLKSNVQIPVSRERKQAIQEVLK